MNYNDPAGGSASSVGTQLNTQYYEKQALIQLKKEQYFSQLADVKSMPKNMGKKIKQYLYLPMLDDLNINDQGIDAAGVTQLITEQYVSFPQATLTAGQISAGVVTYVSVLNAAVAASTATINDNINTAAKGAETVATAGAADSAGTGRALITLTKTSVRYLNTTKTTAVTALNIGAVVKPAYGNMYGSSKDIGAINGKMPVLSESGGRVNRVGFKRKELEGSLEKFGFFDEYTQESLDFDTDSELQMHIHREMLAGANEITEDALQIDLLTAAGAVRYPGTATSNQLLGSGTAANSLVGYGDIMRLSIDLDNNRCPKSTTIITGTRMVDTKTIPAGRIMYIGSELLPTIKAMKDLHNNPAFVSVEKYAAGGTTVTGEVGSIDQFRLVVVPEMVKWAGAGAPLGGATLYYGTNDHFDVFPMLVVGDGSFTTIGFQTDGKSVKFVITSKKPGEATADRNDPYGETGFMSIKWYYGFMALRPERIGLIKTIAAM
jgi:N4-gp56 family major capsid protein